MYMYMCTYHHIVLAVHWVLLGLVEVGGITTKHRCLLHARPEHHHGKKNSEWKDFLYNAHHVLRTRPLHSKFCRAGPTLYHFLSDISSAAEARLGNGLALDTRATYTIYL